MFGRRSGSEVANPRAAVPVAAPAPATMPEAVVSAAQAASEEMPVHEMQNPSVQAHSRQRSEEYYDVKTTVFNALIDTIDLTQLAKLDAAAAREEIRCSHPERARCLQCHLAVADTSAFPPR